MVNTINLSCYSGSLPPTVNKGRTKISGGPLYDCKTVLSILEQGESVIRPWTKKCVSDLQKYSMDHSDILELLQHALRIGNFKGSEWCVAKENGPFAACDSYQVFRDEWVPYAQKFMQIEYYVKFAIGRTGNIILVASCHGSENR
jgi:hypothetical protein